MSGTTDNFAIPFLLWLLVLLPAMSIVGFYRQKKAKIAIQKKKRYLAVIAFQLILLIITFEAASADRIHLFHSTPPSRTACLVGLVILVTLVFSAQLSWKRLTEERKEQMRMLLPEVPSDLWYWTVISLFAGIGEECAYRGVAYTLLYWIFDSAVVGLIISIVAFALMHSHQGWYGAVWAGALGWIFQLMVFATGTLYLAIAVHAMYDVLIGVMFLRLLNNENMTGTRLGEMERTPPS